MTGFFISNKHTISHYNSANYPHPVVVNVSKVKISKAIHNKRLASKIPCLVVVNVSKVKISKAIHNSSKGHT